MSPRVAPTELVPTVPALIMLPADDTSAPRWIEVPFEVSDIYEGLRIDQFLAKRLRGYSRARVQHLLSELRVTVEGQPCRASRRVRRGEHVHIFYLRRPEAPLSEAVSIPILYEDDHLLVIDKPADLICHPTDKIVAHTVLGYLRHLRPDLPSLHLLHRLDRETSGVLALGKTVTAARQWTRLMSRHQIRKTYVALAQGHVSACRIDSPIGPQGGVIKVRQSVHTLAPVSAVTHVRPLAYGIWDEGPCTLLMAAPKTGRLHQIRVHLASRGFPLLGDLLYSGEGELYQKMVLQALTDEDRDGLGFRRVALHARSLHFKHPVSGVPLRIVSPIPADIKRFITHYISPRKPE